MNKQEISCTKIMADAVHKCYAMQLGAAVKRGLMAKAQREKKRLRARAK